MITLVVPEWKYWIAMAVLAFLILTLWYQDYKTARYMKSMDEWLRATRPADQPDNQVAAKEPQR